MILSLTLFTRVAAQQNDQFWDFSTKEKNLMLKAYAKKDIPGFKKNLDDFQARYNQLSDKEKKMHTWTLEEEYYLLAGLYATAGDKTNAIKNLIKSNNYDYDELTNDPELKGLQQDPRFQQYLEEAKKPQSSYLELLRKEHNYNLNEKDDLPLFTYQKASNPNLAFLEKKYNLDSIAGKGNDVSKIINLMKWVHYAVPHDGSKGNPDIKNAAGMIEECRHDNKTLNCRGLAITLNEVYLAAGFKSRYVTCLPKDTTDGDCHVITMAWAPSLKKWLWMDPTFMAYVMDEKGNLLSIEEVRERLIAGKPLIMNPDANHNNDESQAVAYLLGNYMAKNLYMLKTPMSSEYNYETADNGKSLAYMQLMPGTVKPQTRMEKNTHRVASYTTYYTNNPKVFWAAPEEDTKTVTVSAQLSGSDFEHVLEQFKNFYNHHDVDSVRNRFADSWGNEKATIWSAEIDKWYADNFGEMKSCKFIGWDFDGSVALLKVECAKSTHVMGISLDSKKKIENFRFSTASAYIDRLLAKEL